MSVARSARCPLASGHDEEAQTEPFLPATGATAGEASPFLDLEGIGGRFAYAWGTLLTYVRTGAPGYSEVFGLPFWEDLAAHP